MDASLENSSVNTDSILDKILIFREDSLYESLNEKNNFIKNNTLIKYDSNYQKSISVINDNNKNIIKIGEHIEDVLRKLKNPNYIYYYNDKDENYNNQENGKILYNQTLNKIYYLNYFQYGLDIMISNNKVSRILLHTNQVGDSKFGIYDRCNFKLKLRQDYLNTLLGNKDENKNSFDMNDNKKDDKKEKENKNSRKSSNNEKILEKKE